MPYLRGQWHLESHFESPSSPSAATGGGGAGGTPGAQRSESLSQAPSEGN